jgi:NitT/TauT family transport system permease protein
VFISFFPVLISTATGLRSVSPEIIKLCRSVGAKPWQVLLKVAFPTALPFIFNGMKITVTLSVIGIVVAEFIAAQAGLGFLILFASSNQQTDLCLAGVAVLCALGLLLYGIVAGAEHMANYFFGEG